MVLSKERSVKMRQKVVNEQNAMHACDVITDCQGNIKYKYITTHKGESTLR